MWLEERIRNFADSIARFWVAGKFELYIIGIDICIHITHKSILSLFSWRRIELDKK